MQHRLAALRVRRLQIEVANLREHDRPMPQVLRSKQHRVEALAQHGLQLWRKALGEHLVNL